MTPCATLSPGAVCSWLCTALMLCTPLGVLVGSDGPLHNVIKIKPPVSIGDCIAFVVAISDAEDCLALLLIHFSVHCCVCVLAMFLCTAGVQ